MVEDKNIDASGWLVTFSDLVMLLLTFFVLLLSMSSMDNNKLRDIHSQLLASIGLLDGSGSTTIESLTTLIRRYQETGSTIVMDRGVSLAPISSELWTEKMRERIEEFNELIDITDDERGIVVSIPEAILFDQGESTIAKDFIPILDSISQAIASCANDIFIMGHTDSVPIHTERYPSNWELSSYRGLSVLGYFLDERGLPPSRFSVGGYGPSRPVYSNDNPEDRAFNRRVEIIFKHIQGA
jgi:chemotaxis protein MotB